MQRVKIRRTESDERGTFGILTTPSGFSCYSLERPRVGDHPCIPDGLYDVKWTSKDVHPKHGPCYEISDVPGRTDVLIHTANWSLELLGCIAPGRAIVDELKRPDGSKLKGVSSSRDALEGLVADLGKLPFELEIIWAPGL